MHFVNGGLAPGQAGISADEVERWYGDAWYR